MYPNGSHVVIFDTSSSKPQPFHRSRRRGRRKRRVWKCIVGLEPRKCSTCRLGGIQNSLGSRHLLLRAFINQPLLCRNKAATNELLQHEECKKCVLETSGKHLNRKHFERLLGQKAALSKTYQISLCFWRRKQGVVARIWKTAGKYDFRANTFFIIGGSPAGASLTLQKKMLSKLVRDHGNAPSYSQVIPEH
jgi:hypothetical protein